MSVAKWHNEGLNRVLNILLGAQAVDGAYYLGLYKNVTELAAGAALADLEEPSGYGYNRITLSRGSWSIVDNAATFAKQTFLADGGDWGDIYGWFLGTTLNNTGKLLASEHFTTKLTVKDGKGIKIIPKVQCST
jgi:hypothetical protein